MGDHDDLTLDPNGNVTTRSHTDLPAGGGSETFVTEFDYDAINRVTQRREIDRSNGANILTTSFGYDSRSDLTWRLDAESHPVRWTYDLASRLVTYERAFQTGQTIEDFTQEIVESFAYDGNSRLTGLTDDNFNSTSYQFDARDRQTRVTYADSRYVDTQYDLDSNVSQWTDQNGTVVQNTFDALDRKTYASVTRGTGVLGSTFEQFSYDALGRALTAVDDDFQVELTWDSVGNLLKERQGYNVQGQEKWKSVATTWSDAGSVQSILYPSAFAAAHTRDAIYRMTSLQDVGAGTNIATFTYQGAGRLATTSNQNGTSTEYSWDGFARIRDIDHKLGGGQTLHKFTYAYDKVHNRRMEQNTFDATWVGTLPQAVQTFLAARNTKGDVYAYDWAYRLTDVRYDTTNPLQEVQNPGSQAFVKNTQYVMDGLGNRSQVLTSPPTPPSTVTYASDVVNQYTQVGGVTRTHDNNGNLTDDGTYLFAYDFENRLVEVKLKSTQALVATYRYDALGRRVEKAVSGGATTRYVLDGQQVIEEYDGQDVWQARYVYEDGIDHPRVMDRADQADVNGNQNTSEVLRFTYHQQALGSVTEISEPGGSVVEWVAYGAHGSPTVYDGSGQAVGQSPIGNPYLYRGKEYDQETGLYATDRGAYDPATGRLLQLCGDEEGGNDKKEKKTIKKWKYQTVIVTIQASNDLAQDSDDERAYRPDRAARDPETYAPRPEPARGDTPGETGPSKTDVPVTDEQKKDGIKKITRYEFVRREEKGDVVIEHHRVVLVIIIEQDPGILSRDSRNRAKDAQKAATDAAKEFWDKEDSKGHEADEGTFRVFMYVGHQTGADVADLQSWANDGYAVVVYSCNPADDNPDGYPPLTDYVEDNAWHVPGNSVAPINSAAGDILNGILWGGANENGEPAALAGKANSDAAVTLGNQPAPPESVHEPAAPYFLPPGDHSNMPSYR